MVEGSGLLARSLPLADHSSFANMNYPHLSAVQSDPMPAPALDVERWFNTEQPITLESLRGRVVVLHFFQMLCPGCVLHGLPQARELHREFDPKRLAVVAIHSVFEHHVVNSPDLLEAFLHENRLTMPVGIDRPGRQNGLPATMASYRLRGTPSLILLDRQGRVREHYFGGISDLVVGAAIARLLME